MFPVGSTALKQNRNGPDGVVFPRSTPKSVTVAVRIAPAFGRTSSTSVPPTKLSFRTSDECAGAVVGDRVAHMQRLCGRAVRRERSDDRRACIADRLPVLD